MYEEQITQYAMRMIVSGVEVVFKTTSRLAMDALARYMAERKHWSDEKKLQELYKNNPYELMLQKGKPARMMVMKDVDAEQLIERCSKSNIECYIQGAGDDPNLVVVTFNAEHANVIERFIEHLGIDVETLKNDVELDNTDSFKSKNEEEATIHSEQPQRESSEELNNEDRETLKTPEGFPADESNTSAINHEEIDNGEPIVKPKEEPVTADINNRINNEKTEKSSSTENFYQARNETDENRSEQVSNNISKSQNTPHQSTYQETTKSSTDSDQRLKNSKNHKQTVVSSMQMAADSRSSAFAVRKESLRDVMKNCTAEANAINKNRREKAVNDQTR